MGEPATEIQATFESFARLAQYFWSQGPGAPEELTAIANEARSAGLTALQLGMCKTLIPNPGGTTGERCHRLRELLQTLAEEAGPEGLSDSVRRELALLAPPEPEPEPEPPVAEPEPVPSDEPDPEDVKRDAARRRADQRKSAKADTPKPKPFRKKAAPRKKAAAKKRAPAKKKAAKKKTARRKKES